MALVFEPDVGGALPRVRRFGGYLICPENLLRTGSWSEYGDLHFTVAVQLNSSPAQNP